MENNSEEKHDSSEGKHDSSGEKRRKKKKHVKDQCYICRSGIKETEKYYPCNCRFGFVHRNCLERWVKLSHQKCRICGLKYHLDRQSDLCFVCLENKEESLIKPCDCDFITVHALCMNEWYNRGDDHHSCPYCDFKYQVKTKVTRNLTCSRWYAPLYIMGGLIYFGMIIFLISGTHLIDAFGWNVNRDFVDLIIESEKLGGFLLFPGTHTTGIVDLLYCITLGFIIIGCIFVIIVYLSMRLHPRQCYSHAEFDLLSVNDRNIAVAEKQKLIDRCKNPLWRLAVFFGIPAAILCLHLFGNIHYQFYGAVGVIPENDRFWMFNGYSFLVGLAGFVLVAAMLLTVVGLGFVFYYCFKGMRWICFKENQSIEVLDRTEV